MISSFVHISRQISVYFADGSKVKVTLSNSQTTSDLLEMSEIKEQLSSSTAYIVRVDDTGKGGVGVQEEIWSELLDVANFSVLTLLER